MQFGESIPLCEYLCDNCGVNNNSKSEILLLVQKSVSKYEVMKINCI